MQRAKIQFHKVPGLLAILEWQRTDGPNINSNNTQWGRNHTRTPFSPELWNRSTAYRQRVAFSNSLENNQWRSHQPVATICKNDGGNCQYDCFPGLLNWPFASTHIFLPSPVPTGGTPLPLECIGSPCWSKPTVRSAIQSLINFGA